MTYWIKDFDTSAYPELEFLPVEDSVVISFRDLGSVDPTPASPAIAGVPRAKGRKAVKGRRAVEADPGMAFTLDAAMTQLAAVHRVLTVWAAYYVMVELVLGDGFDNWYYNGGGSKLGVRSENPFPAAGSDAHVWANKFFDEALALATDPARRYRPMADVVG